MKIMSKCATSKIESVLVREESRQSVDIKLMRSFRVLPTIKRMVNVLSLLQVTKTDGSKNCCRESINFPLSVRKSLTSVRIVPMTSGFNRPLLYRLSYEARREQVVRDTGGNWNKC